MQTTERALPLPVTGTKRIYLMTFFTVITVAPFFIAHVQLLTGPLVNAVLILACVLLGPREAVALGFFPSTVALLSGLLPFAFAPMVPFIILSNALYVFVFHECRRSSASIGIIAGSVLKYLFLISVVRLIMSRFIDASVLPTLTMMMGLPQLVTALLGGVIALALLSVLRRRA